MSSRDIKIFHILNFDKFVKSFYNLVVKSQLNCPKDSYFLSIICFWVGFFQISSMLITFNDTKNNMDSSTVSWTEGWKLLVYICRPIQFIYQGETQEHQDLNRAVIIVLFLYLAVQILIAIICSQLIESNNKAKQKSAFTLLNLFVNSSIYFNMLLCIPVMEISFFLAFQGSLIDPNKIHKISAVDQKNISGNQSSTTSNVSSSEYLSSANLQTNKLCGYVLFILYQIYSFMNSRYYEISYSLEERGIQKYSSDNLSILLNHLRIGAVISYTSDPQNESSGRVLASCFASLYFVLTIYEYFIKKPYSSIAKSNNYLVALITNFIFVVFMIIDKVAGVGGSSKSVTFILLILPITIKLFIGILYKMNDTYLFANLLDENEINSTNDEQLSRKISMLYNNRDLILNQDQIKLFGIYEQHKLTCRRPICFCQHNIIKCHEGTVFLLDSDILNRYIRYLIRTELVNSNLNEKIDRLVHFIRYMTNLSIQKKHSFAISKVIDFINESDRMRKSYGTYVRVCVDTVLNILKQIMFKNIVQTIVDDEIEQQLVDIDLYIRMDMEKAILKDVVYKCIQKRIEIFEKMRKNFEDFTELEQLNLEYNQYLDELENRFHIFYERFPTRQNQCFYIFFQSEVKGNLKKAIQISNTRKFQQTSEGKKLFNVFEPNVLYLTATMGKIWGKIVNFSDKLPIALGYKKQEFNYVTHIKDIMPTSIAAIHDEIIRCMMTQGNDTIINNKRQIFLKNKNNFLIRVNVFISLNLYYAEELPFGVFVTPVETRSGFLFITSQGYVEGMDSNVLNQVGYNNITNLPPFYQFKVQNCLPEFEHYAQHMAENNLTLYDKVDIPFNFYSRSHPMFQKIFTTKNQSLQDLMKLQSQSSIKNYSEQESSLRQSMKKTGSQSQNMNILKFKADITIERHRIKMLESTYVYYIVEIKYIVRVTNNDEYFTMSSNKTVNNMQTTYGIGKSVFNQTKKVQKVQAIEATSLIEYVKGIKEMDQNDEGNLIVTNPQIEDNQAALTDHQQKQQFLGIQFSNPDLNTVPSQNTSIGNIKTDDLRQQDFEIQPSAIRDELNLDQIHMTQRQAANLPLDLFQKTNTVNVHQKSLQTQNDFSIIQNNQLDSSVMNNPLLEYTQVPNQNMSYSVSQDVSALNSANRLYQKNDDNKVKSGKNIQEQEIPVLMNSGLLNQQIETNLNEAVQNKQEIKVEYKKKSYTIPNEKQRGDLKDRLHKHEREGSLTSSTDALNRSMDKYNYYEEFISSQHHPIHLKMIRIGRLVEYLILLIVTIASILTLYTSFDILLQNIDTLTLHSNILEPYANTLVISNANYLVQSYSLPAFNNQQTPILASRFDMQYNSFNTMIKDEWQNSYLTSYFTDKYLDIFHSYKLNQGAYLSNQNLLTSSSRLLYNLNEVKQYTVTEVKNQLNQVERQFLAVNYPQFVEFFKGVVQETLDDSISYNNSLTTNIIVQTVVLNIITLFIFCLSGWNYYHFSKNLISILKMCETASTIAVEREMYRYQKMQEELAENENVLFNYVFSIQQKEQELSNMVEKNYISNNEIKSHSSNLHSGSQVGGTKRKKLLVSVQHERINYTGFVLFIFCIYLLFVTFTITTYAINTNFLNLFEPAIKYYKSVSDADFQISQLPALKSLINEYQWIDLDPNKQTNIQYINSNLSSLKSLYDIGLDSILSFGSEILDFNKLDFFSSSFKSEMDDIINGNICLQSDDKFDNSWNTKRCEQIQNGVLTQGLQNSLSKWYDVLHSFQQIGYKETLSYVDQATYQIDQTFQSITLSNYTTIMRNTVKDSLSKNTQNQKNINLIISLIFISLVSIIYLYEMFKGMKSVSYRFQMAKKIIFLVPLQTVMIEETFIKILKAQSNRLEIVK